MSKEIKNTFIYSLSQYIYLGMSFIFGMFIRRILGPSIIGINAYIGVIEKYIDFLYAPIRTAIGRDIILIKENKKELKELIDNSFSILIVLTIFSSLVILVIYITNSNYIMKFGLLILVIKNFATSFSLYFKIYELCNKNFKKISIIFLLMSGIQTIITYYLTYKYGYKGYFIGVLASSIIMLFLYIYKSDFNFTFKLDFKVIKKIYSVGIPLFLYTLVFTSFQNVDKIIIKNKFGFLELGYYNIADLFFMNLYILPQSVYSVQYPKLLELISQNKIVEIEKKIEKTTILVKDITIILILVSYMILPVFINLIMPDFMKSIPLVKILLLGLLFNSIYVMEFNYLVSKNIFKPVIIFSFLILFIAYILNLCFVKTGLGSIGISISTDISYFMLSFGILCIKEKYFGEFSKEFFERIKKYYADSLVIIGIEIMDFLTVGVFKIKGYKNILILLVLVYYVINFLKKYEIMTLIKKYRDSIKK